MNEEYVMPDKSVIPWHQYAAISYMAANAKGSPSLGKTAMQKLIYLVQELQDVPIGYRFQLYNYGPYSSDLAEDLTYVEFLDGIKVDFDPVQNSYKIHAAKASDFLIGKASDFIAHFRQGIDRIIQEFGNRKVRELELIATAVYASRILKELDSYSEERLIEQVREIKPKFSNEEIVEAIKELEGLRYVA
jgi:uncharacterized protein YwgA